MIFQMPSARVNFSVGDQVPVPLSAVSSVPGSVSTSIYAVSMSVSAMQGPVSAVHVGVGVGVGGSVVGVDVGDYSFVPHSWTDLATCLQIPYPHDFIASTFLGERGYKLSASKKNCLAHSAVPRCQNDLDQTIRLHWH